MKESVNLNKILSDYQLKKVSRLDTARLLKELQEKAMAAHQIPSETAEGSTDYLEISIQDLLLQKMSSTLGVGENDVSVTDNFMDLGIDSIRLIEISEELEQQVSIELYPTIFFEYQNIESLTKYLIQEYADKFHTFLDIPKHTLSSLPFDTNTTQDINSNLGKSAQALPSTGSSTVARHSDIAIIGMSGVFPQSPDLTTFWHHLYNGSDLITEIPTDHFDYKPWFSTDSEANDTLYCKWGGFIDDVDKFDADFFQISRREAETMDPQLRYLLQTFYHTAEDAGYINRIRNSRTGVYVGVCSHDYHQEMYRLGKPVGAHDGTGNAMSMHANRPSFYFNLTGPSFAVDTACSSSLYSVHLACKALRNNECDMAFAAGVNLLLTSMHYRYFCSIGALSKSGRCHTFDNRADGYVPAEAVGAVLLKPLDSAILDGDLIHGVIKGSAISHGGYTPSITAPSVDGEAAVIEAALKDADINPESITYIETHGTGTPLGDPVEINALKKVFENYTQDANFCSIGSAKAHIGHAEGAAGIAGLIKVLLAMKYKVIPCMPKFDTLNPYIELDQSPFYINKQAQEWVPRKDKSGNFQCRRAGTSSFGFGGAYAHLVVEEYVDQGSGFRVQGSELGTRDTTEHKELKGKNQEQFLIVLSAKDEKRLLEIVRNLHQFLTRNPTADTRNPKPETQDLQHIAYTLQVSREAMEERLAFLSTSTDHLISQLTCWCEDDRIGCYYGRSKNKRSVAKLFKSEKDKRQTVSDWLATRHYEKLAECWIKGVDIDWKDLYKNGDGRHISLPNYPFSKKRYWINTQSLSDGRTRTGIRHLHPLIHENVSSLEVQCFKTTFTGKESFLRDHQINEKHLLPAVAYLEMARAAGMLAATDKNLIQLKNVVWRSPIAFEKKTLEILLRLYPENENRVIYELSTGNTEQSPIIHGRGTLVFGELTDSKPKDIEAIRDRCQKASSIDKIYENFNALGFRYGDSFKSIDKLWYNNHEGLACLKLRKDNTHQNPEYFLPPGLFDGALQCIIAIEQERNTMSENVLLLPFSLEELTLYKPLTTPCYAHVSCISSSPNLGNTYDIQLLNDNGDVLLNLKNFNARPLAARQGTSLDTKTPGTLFAIPEWHQTKEISESDQKNENITLFFSGNDKRIAELLAKTFELANLTPLPPCNFDGNDIKKIIKCVATKLKTLLKEKLNSSNSIWIIVPDDDISKIVYGSLSGLLKTANMENPKICGKLIYYSAKWHDNLDKFTTLLRQECLFTDHGFTEIRYTDKWQREEKRFRELDETANIADSTELKLESNSCYWITGGLGGLGIIFAEYLGKINTSITIILSGRSTLDRDKQAQLNLLCDQGISVVYLQCDVANRNDVARTVKVIEKEHGPIKGIIHSAGIAKDALLINKTAAEFDIVLKPKISGLMALDHGTRNNSLDFFVFFSSIAGAFGNPGQSDYAAANAFLDGFASHRQELVQRGERYGKTISINWPFWNDGGMRIEPQIEQMMTEIWGLTPLQKQTGLDIFEHVMSFEFCQVVVVQGTLEKIRKHLFLSNQTLSPENNNQESNQNVNHSIVDKVELEQKLHEEFKNTVAKLLDVEQEYIELGEELSTYGFDSITLTEFANKVNTQFGLELTPAIFFQYASISDFTDFLISEHSDVLVKYFGLMEKQPQTQIPAEDAEFLPKTKPLAHKPRFSRQSSYVESPAPMLEPVAVIGINGRFPKAENIRMFWQNLLDSKECISEIPMNRWDWKLFYGNRYTEFNKTEIKWGCFIDGVDEFDPIFFGISPSEADRMDPQQRLLLQSVWGTMEDAGYAPASLAGTNTGVFIGSSSSDYVSIMEHSHSKLDACDTTGTLRTFMGSRLSYFFDLKGPCEIVDSACSSVIVALNRAVKCLQKSECKMAIIGGINLILSPQGLIAFDQSGVLSENGKVNSFDESANGYVRGEGVGTALLKPLSQAETDRDHIYGLIRGIAVNHSGRSQSMTAPNINAQTEVMITAYEQGNIDPTTVTYIEAHGTATPLGDAAEIEAYKNAFRHLYAKHAKNLSEVKTCGISSIKPNIGYLEGASGIASLFKVLFSLKNGMRMPVKGFKQLHSNIKLDGTPFYMLESNEDWPRLQDERNREIPRRASLHSFGFGGVNAHAVIEEYIDQVSGFRVQGSGVKTKGTSDNKEIRGENHEQFLIVLSAKNEKRLSKVVGNLHQFLTRNLKPESLKLQDLAYTLQVGRNALKERLVFIVQGIDELVNVLSHYLESKKRDCSTGTVFRGKKGGATPEVKLLTTGKAGHYFIEGCIKERDWEKIALVWSQGIDISWDKLYHNDGSLLKRISLPTYPFEKKRYWIDESSKINKAIQVALGVGREPSPGTVKPVKKATSLLSMIADFLAVNENEICLEKSLSYYGVDSIQLGRLRNKIASEWQVEIPLESLVTLRSINDLVQLVENQVRSIPAENQSLSIGTKSPVDITSEQEDTIPDYSQLYPLSFEQTRHWVAAKLSGGNSSLNLPLTLKLEGRVTEAFLYTALDALVKRHDVLRTVFVEKNGIPFQKICPHRDFRLIKKSFKHYHKEKKETGLATYIQTAENAPFDLENGPLFRFYLICLDRNKYLMLTVFNHIITDILSVKIFADELWKIYNAFDKGDHWDLPKLTGRYMDYVTWERQHYNQHHVNTEISFWRDQLGGKNVEIDFPFSATPSTGSRAGNRPECFAKIFSEKISDKVRTFVNREGHSPFNILLTAFNAFLFAHAEPESVTIGVPLSNRDSIDYDNIMGFFSLLGILSVDINEDQTFQELYKTVNQEMLNVQLHKLPFSELAKCIPEKGRGRPPLQIVFSYIGNNFVNFAVEFKDLNISIADSPQPDLDFELVLIVRDDGTQFKITLNYLADYFSSDYISFLLDRFERTVEYIIDHFKEPVRSLYETPWISRRDHLHIIGNFTIEPLTAPLKCWIKELELGTKVNLCDYNQIFQELIQPNSFLRTNPNGINVILLRLEEWAHDYKKPFVSTKNWQKQEKDMAHNTQMFIDAMTSAVDDGIPYLVIFTANAPDIDKNSHWQTISRKTKQSLIEGLSSFEHITFIDDEEIMKLYPVRDYHDPEQLRLGHVPYTGEYYSSLATQIIRAIHSRVRIPFKAIVVDCDNTLWSGIIGEEGLDHIQVTPAYSRFQKSLAAQKNAGMLLCISSKNNPSDIKKVFQKCNDMVLNYSDFTIVKANWKNKSENIRDIADELSIGLDSIIFVDDNEVECGEVKAIIPEVLTIPFSNDDEKVLRLTDHTWAFDHYWQTQEDRLRPELYQQNLRRTQEQKKKASWKVFIEGLELKISIRNAIPKEYSRIAQLTQRTNQFNTTVKRLSEREIKQNISDGSKCIVIHVKDRFGDYGLVGTAFYQLNKQQLNVDSMMLSCRVLGRTVEYELLKYLGKTAIENHIADVTIDFVQTEKNQPVKNFLTHVLNGKMTSTAEGKVYRMTGKALQAIQQVGWGDLETTPKKSKKKKQTTKDCISRELAMARNERILWLQENDLLFNRNMCISEPQCDNVKRAQLVNSDPSLNSEGVSVDLVSVSETEQSLSIIWQNVLDRDVINPNDDFFELGGTSLQAVEMLGAISKKFLRSYPEQHFFDSPRIKEMAKFLDGLQKNDQILRNDQIFTETLRADSQLDASLKPLPFDSDTYSVKHILLTGATGFLGGHILNDLLTSTNAKIHCLVRKNGRQSMTNRIIHHLKKYKLWKDDFHKRIISVRGDLSKPLFGLSTNAFSKLSKKIDTIIHAGAQVNFLFPYDRLKSINVKGTQTVLQLACTGQAKVVHHISTNAIFDAQEYLNTDTIVCEDVVPAKPPTLIGGYTQSKWVSERLVANAGERGLPIVIYRPGGISGSSQTGIMNSDDILSVLLQLCISVKKIPNIFTHFDFVPVDFVSRIIVGGVNHPFQKRVYHILHLKPVILAKAIRELKKMGIKATAVPYADWLKAVKEFSDREVVGELAKVQPLLQSSTDGTSLSWLESITARPQFQHNNTKSLMKKCGINVPPLDHILFARYFKSST